MASGKLFVGNLPWSTTEDALKEHFSQCGDVYGVKIIKDQESGRSRGFGFVEMTGHEEAIAQLDGKVFEGRPLAVKEARQKA